MLLHDVANKKVAYFQPIYRHVPMFFPTLMLMVLSCLFYWFLSWYLEKVFPGKRSKTLIADELVLSGFQVNSVFRWIGISCLKGIIGVQKNSPVHHNPILTLQWR